MNKAKEYFIELAKEFRLLFKELARMSEHEYKIMFLGFSINEAGFTIRPIRKG